MLSIVICSRKQNPDKEFLKNIEETVGCEHELIIVDNSKNDYSIFQAYNYGIDRSTGTILCFMHDDIQIHTLGWGKIAGNLFQEQPDVALLGIAGSKLKTKMPSAWWDCPEDFKFLYLIQHLHNGENVKWERGFENKSESEVALIDGVFMLMRKETGIRFNENLKGFHNYDMNISLEAFKKGYRILVTSKILIEHFSMGKIDKDWVQSSLEFQKLYGRNLPLNVGEAVTPELLHKLEVDNGMNFINRLLEAGYKKEAFYFWRKLFFLKPFSRIHVKLFKNFREY